MSPPLPQRCVSPGDDEKREAKEVKEYEKYESIASSLPLYEVPRSFVRLQKYQNFWYPQNLTAPTIAMQYTFEARPSDIILATFPKSGTTWLKAVIFSIINRTRYPPFDMNHPLMNSSPHDCFPFLHTLYEHKLVPRTLLDAMPSPRLLAIHTPFSSLPASVAESGCRIIYLCRDPKDAIVSVWYYVEKMKPAGYESTPPLSDFVELFCNGVFWSGPFWDHTLGYWNESAKRPKEVAFLRYEQLAEDTVGSVRRLADFLGCPFSKEEEESGVPESIARFCSIDRMKSVDANMNGEHGVGITFKNSAFFRKGKVGDWKEHMTPEMAKRLDAIVEQKLRGSGLAFNT